MVSERQRVFELIYRALDEVNRQLPAEKRLAKVPTTELYSEASVLDSLALVNLIIATEEYIEDDYGIYVPLSEQTITDRSNNPFKTVESFADFIEAQLQKSDQ